MLHWTLDPAATFTSILEILIQKEFSVAVNPVLDRLLEPSEAAKMVIETEPVVGALDPCEEKKGGMAGTGGTKLGLMLLNTSE